MRKPLINIGMLYLQNKRLVSGNITTTITDVKRKYSVDVIIHQIVLIM